MQGGKNKKLRRQRWLENGVKSKSLDFPGGAYPKNPPGHLSRHAKKFWRTLTAQLVEAGVLKAPDRLAWECLCESYATIIEAQAVIAAEGLLLPGRKGELVKNPASSVLSAARQHFRLACGEFGLTPVSRERLGLPEPDLTDPISQLLNGGEVN